MAEWFQNEANPALRRVTVDIYYEDGVSYAPFNAESSPGVPLSAADCKVRKGNFAWVAAGGTLTNTGVDGKWVYEASQAEINYVGTEFEVMFVPPIGLPPGLGFARAVSYVVMKQPQNISTSSIADIVTGVIFTFFSFVLRPGRTVLGHLRRMDGLFFSRVDGLKAPTVEVYQPGAVTLEYDVDQNVAAGTRDEADCTTSEIP